MRLWGLWSPGSCGRKRMRTRLVLSWRGGGRVVCRRKVERRMGGGGGGVAERVVKEEVVLKNVKSSRLVAVVVVGVVLMRGGLMLGVRLVTIPHKRNRGKLPELSPTVRSRLTA